MGCTATDGEDRQHEFTVAAAAPHVSRVATGSDTRINKWSRRDATADCAYYPR